MMPDLLDDPKSSSFRNLPEKIRISCPVTSPFFGFWGEGGVLQWPVNPSRSSDGMESFTRIRG